MSVYESELNINTPTYVPGGNYGEHESHPDMSHGLAPRTTASAIEDKGIHRRRRWTHEEKKAIVAETEGPGASISGVARKYGIAPRLLFSWRRQLSEEMALTTRSGAKIVPISIVRDLEKKIRELEEALEKKTNEICNLTRALESNGAEASH